MDKSLRAQIDAYLAHLDHLIRHGRQLRDALAADSPDASAITATRAWQEDCGTTVNQLSGGQKSHWLARSYSEAFLMRSPAGGAMESAAPSEIIGRLIGVLEQAMTTLSRMDAGTGASQSSDTSFHRRFEFVRNVELRAAVAQAYSQSQQSLEQGRYEQSLPISCGVLEAIVTDALEHSDFGTLASAEAPAGKVADWSFEARLAVAERAGLIHKECARLPLVARKYRDLTDGDGRLVANVTVSERDARQVHQVLNVVIRDLDPGR